MLQGMLTNQPNVQLLGALLSHHLEIGQWKKKSRHNGGEDKEWYVPHLCRHTCATRLVQRGVPLGVVKDWMGHECIQATMIYAHHAPKQLHEAVKVLNTRESSASIAS